MSDSADDLPKHPAAPSPGPATELTLGVEEEFFLADQRTRHAVRRAAVVVDDAKIACGPAHVESEMAQAQVECVGRVCRDRHEVLAEVRRLRRGAAESAAAHGCLLVAGGTSILGDPGPTPLLDKPRYASIGERFGLLVEQQCVNACHVHVGIPDREEAVQVTNWLRLWTPVLLALSANSPFWLGTDSAYASWRTSLWGRWPTSGPPPYLRSADHYEQVVDRLVESGAALDPAMLYWHVRPSRHVPTVEVRVADVMPDAAGTAAFALLVRAMTAAALSRVRRGQGAPAVEDAVLRAACWQASRSGARGNLLTTTGQAGSATFSRPVWAQLAAARGELGDALDRFGDRPTVLSWLASVRRHGTGADRQRAARAGPGGFAAAVDVMAVSPPPARVLLTHEAPAPPPTSTDFVDDTKER
ncbi:carboxylate-amine ligase [Streptomyces candidus]|uniref:Putative glutamate--cysteine ligase 2 n=1 Tax=Streptomyces candidus TaxID=67283 RepID=A0A7X0HKS5_9ACTN|nr:glutamate--cysteine ligase [Streptomyces candidus]MBB6439495.1 carboxylate-amine ligase [Streptomyces candidus]